jgi:hypothetical protein
MRNPLKVIATVGLVLGGVFGIAGTMVTPQLQAILWAIDGAGLMMATVLLTIKYFRTGNDVVAGGFLVFAIGEGVLLSTAAAHAESSIPSFAAVITLWGTALLLVSIPRLLRSAAPPKRWRPHSSPGLFIAPDERRQVPLPRVATAAACPHDPEQRNPAARRRTIETEQCLARGVVGILERVLRNSTASPSEFFSRDKVRDGT